jgi:hypothetical protein
MRKKNVTLFWNKAPCRVRCCVRFSQIPTVVWDKLYLCSGAATYLPLDMHRNPCSQTLQLNYDWAVSSDFACIVACTVLFTDQWTVYCGSAASEHWILYSNPHVADTMISSTTSRLCAFLIRCMRIDFQANLYVQSTFDQILLHGRTCRCHFRSPSRVFMIPGDEPFPMIVGCKRWM